MRAFLLLMAFLCSFTSSWADERAEEKSLTSMGIIKATDDFILKSPPFFIPSTPAMIAYQEKAKHQLSELEAWHKKAKAARTLTALQSALIELRIAELSHINGNVKAQPLWKAGKYLIENFPLGHELHAEGLDALYNCYMIIGPTQAMIDIAEQQLNPENIKAIARRAMKEKSAPLCEAKVHVLRYYLMATSMKREATVKKRLAAENEILNSSKACLNKDTEASILRDLSEDSRSVGDTFTAVTTARRLVNEFTDDQAIRSTVSLIRDYAHALRQSGNTTEAISQIIIALDLATNARETEWANDLRYDYAIILIDDGQLDRAEQMLVELLGETSEEFTLAQLYSRLSAIAERKGEFQSAIFLQKISLRYAHQTRRSYINSVASKGRVDAVDLVNPLFEDYYRRLSRLLIAVGRITEAEEVMGLIKVEEHFDFVRRSISAAPRDKLSGSYNSHEKNWLDRYNKVSSKLIAIAKESKELDNKAKQGLTKEEKKRQSELRVDLKVAQAAFQSFLSALHAEFSKGGKSREFDLTESSIENLKVLQSTLKTLDHDSVLLRYFITEKKVDILLISPTVLLARETYIESGELNHKIAEFRRLLRDPNTDPKPAAQELYNILIAPIASDLEQAGAKTVMLSQDGTLRYVPFGALYDGKKYLVENYRLPIYSDVTKDNLLEAVNTNWRVAGLGTTRKIGEFKALPAVRQELSSIVRTKNMVSGTLPGEAYLDQEFTEHRFRDVTRRNFQVIHIASHFVFSPGTEINSFLLLGNGKQITLGDIRTGGWSFANVDLLTLSACNTGMGGGRDERGREIEGFGVIAQQRGAKAVLATLWSVTDQSTSIFMQELYRSRQEKHLTKAEALREAQLALISGNHKRPTEFKSMPAIRNAGTDSAPAFTSDPSKPYAHPYYWAPFILMGNWL